MTVLEFIGICIILCLVGEIAVNIVDAWKGNK